MNAPLSSQEADRLRKVVALFDSDNDGEALNALRRARSIATDKGARLADVLTISAPCHDPGPIPVSPMRSHQMDAANCLSWPESLTGWEQVFCREMRMARTASPRQREILASIVAKVRRTEERACA